MSAFQNVFHRECDCKRFLLFTFLFIVSGCSVSQFINAVIEKPSFKYDSYRLVDAKKNSITVEVNLVANNSNSFGMKDVFLNYELLTDGKRLFQGSNVEIALSPKGETLIQVPVKIVYSDAIAASESILNRVLKGEKSIPLSVSIHIFGTPTLMSAAVRTAAFSVDFETTQEIIIPIPVEELDKLKVKAFEQLKKLF